MTQTGSELEIEEIDVGEESAGESVEGSVEESIERSTEKSSDESTVEPDDESADEPGDDVTDVVVAETTMGEMTETGGDGTAAPVQGELDMDEPLPPDIEIAFNDTTLPLSSLLESLLFVADTPVEPSQVAKTLDISRKVAEVGLARLARVYREDSRGLRLLVRDETYQLVTLPEAAPAIETFLSLDLTSKLSGPALEVLAVVAYRQPATRAQIEAVRGVDCAGVLRSLLQRGLIEEVGRLETVGRPILYGVTDLFMQHFGLTDMEELPPLGSEEADTLWAATELVEDEA